MENNMIVKEGYQGIDESNAIIKADVHDGKYCWHSEHYFEEKMKKNEEPDFEEWFFEHSARLEKLKDDLAKFYEITHLPEETIEKVYQLAWDLAMENIDEDGESSMEDRTGVLQDVVDRFGDLADLFKI